MTLQQPPHRRPYQLLTAQALAPALGHSVDAVAEAGDPAGHTGSDIGVIAQPDGGFDHLLMPPSP